MTADGAVLEVDLDALAANWRTLRDRHAAPVAAVLKADGYGLGATSAVRRLLSEGCGHFFTAHLSEAVALRDAVPPGALLAALNGLFPGDAARYRASGVTPVLGSLAELDEWRTTGGGPALLHVDTGLNRLGLSPQELDVLAVEPGRLAGIDLLYIMTHLASAEAPDDPANERQRARFAAICDRLPRVPRSLANSSGVFLGAGFRSDLARAGAALYGVNPTPGRPNPMRPVARLRARVLQLRDVPPGGAVGYNGAWQATRQSRIATACVGYADGWFRSLSNRGYACFDRMPVPLVGRVSMDLTTFDVTDAPGVVAGTWLDLIGPGVEVDAVAERAGTSGYEVLTALGARYRRVYLGADATGA